MVTRDLTGIKNNGPLPKPDEIRIPDDIGNLLTEYIDSTNFMLDELETAALAYEAAADRREPAAAIRRILHKLKGEASMVGVEDMSELCHHAEDAFECMAENKRVDMLLRFKDWASTAMQKLAQDTQNQEVS